MTKPSYRLTKAMCTIGLCATVVAQSFQVENKQQDNVSLNGQVSIKDTSIKENCEIRGQAHIQNSKLNHLTIWGQAKVRQTQLSGRVKIYGYLEGQQLTINEGVSVWGNQIHCASCQLKEIQIHSYNQPPPHIWLSEGTMVRGNITFTGTPGVVNLSSGAQVEGQVINGQVISGNNAV